MSLRALGELFGTTPLYKVGGAVRCELLGVPAHDIDITASMMAEDVISLLDGSDFSVVPSSLRMGTLIIRDGADKYEYTAFRSDSYPLESGVHQPIEVKFTRDISVDARRRDFTVNAIYENVLTGEIVDPLGGVEDLRDRVLRTTREPESVFGEDGLRLMRLVRFKAEMGFDIDSRCYEVASSLVHLLSDISVERIEEEFTKILLADTAVYGNEDGHYEGVRMLVDIGAMQYIIPRLMEGKGMMQNTRYHRYDVLEHGLMAMRYSHPSVRLAALLHDIAKPYEKRTTGNMYAHAISGARFAREALMRLRYQTKVVDEVSALIGIHMFDIDGNARVNTVKKFIVDHHAIMDKFLLLRHADIMASHGDLTSYNVIKGIYDEMKRNGVPMSIPDLAIDGNDVMALGYTGRDIGKILDTVLYKVAIEDVPNDKDTLTTYIRGEKWR